MRVLFLTDSLSLPREGDGEVVKYNETYINLLRKRFPEFLIVDCAIGGATIWDLFKQSFYYKYFDPQLVIIHCGIVDCAPRAFTLFEKKLLKKLGLKPKRLIRFLRKYRGYRLTPQKKFEKICVRLKNQFFGVPVWSIGIMPASLAYEKKLPGIIKSIAAYNQILAENFNFIDNREFPLEGILGDHHHLNGYGHKVLTERLNKVLFDTSNQ